MNSHISCPDDIRERVIDNAIVVFVCCKNLFDQVVDSLMSYLKRFFRTLIIPNLLFDLLLYCYQLLFAEAVLMMMMVMMMIIIIIIIIIIIFFFFWK